MAYREVAMWEILSVHKSRIVPLSGDASREMDDYLLRRRSLPPSAGEPLLCSRRQGLRPYTAAGLAQGLRRLSDGPA